MTHRLSTSGIPYLDSVWNVTSGCTKISPACANCYAEVLHNQRHKALLDGKKMPECYREPFERVVLHEDRLDAPLRARKGRTIGVCFMSDLFHEDVPNEFLDRVFAVMGLCPQHRFVVLTKRPERMREYVCRRRGTAVYVARSAEVVGRNLRDSHPGLAPSNWRRNGMDQVHAIWPLPNVALGVTVWDQASADRAVPILLDTPAALRFVSIEPMLGPVDLRYLQPSDPPVEINALAGTHGVLRPHEGENDRLDWVICGGESGPNARPMHTEWARSLRDQCQSAGVPFYFKQVGEWVPYYHEVEVDPLTDDRSTWIGDFPFKRVGTKRAGHLLGGREHREIPEGWTTA